MNNAKLTALCGMITALSVVLMLISTVLPILMYVLPFLTGLLVLFIEDLSGKKYAVAVFFCVSLLSLIFLTDKETALAYVLFFGYYPIIKEPVEKLPKLLAYLLKFAIFNTAAVLSGVIAVSVFGVSGEEYAEFGKYTVPIFLALANVMFILYDLSIIC